MGICASKPAAGGGRRKPGGPKDKKTGGDKKAAAAPRPLPGGLRLAMVEEGIFSWGADGEPTKPHAHVHWLQPVHADDGSGGGGGGGDAAEAAFGDEARRGVRCGHQFDYSRRTSLASLLCAVAVRNDGWDERGCPLVRVAPEELERVRGLARVRGAEAEADAARLEADEAARRDVQLARDLERRKRIDPFGEARGRKRGQAAAAGEGAAATATASPGDRESEGWEGWGGLGGVGAKRRAVRG